METGWATLAQAPGWTGTLVRLWRDRIAARLDTRNRELRVLESLCVGGRKQLLLVACGQERYLVGTGQDAVQTIVRVGHTAEPVCEATL